MAEKISLTDLDDENKKYIQTELEIRLEKRTDECFDVEDGAVYLPLAFARSEFVLPPVEANRTESGEFAGRLRDEQSVVFKATIDRLRSNGYSIISARPGFGKTISAIALACELGVKTAVVVNKLVLIQQWMDSLDKYCPSGVVQYVTPKTAELNETASFYVVNAINVRKKPRSFWHAVKFLVVDELHQIVTRVLTQSLLSFTPAYNLGLSATPYRFDEYDGAIKWFFGSEKNGQELRVAHDVRIVSTGWSPSRVMYTRMGMDWNGVLNAQAESDARNNLIVSECLDRPDRTWLVLVKRVAHARVLRDKFAARNAQCSILVGTATTFDRRCSVLVGTTSKIGVGFDHAAIDALCIAADVKNYFVQFLGRCMRRPDSNPIVLDFRDAFGTLEKHLDERIVEYKRRGGRVSESPSRCSTKKMCAPR